MTKKDILELKRRLKKNECTFTRMCGCYVDCEKNVILNIEETFLNLKEEEFFKYLEIARKTLSGTIGNNLLELEFPLEEENLGGRQQFLMGLKESRLRNEALLERFYQLVIDSYDYAGNYLILLFHDAYDVMTKTTDNNKLDESEEVYEYLLCAICPVELSKPGLGYREDEHRIGARIRDWVVSAPENGFVFPAFTDRSTDIHSVMYYAKNAKDPHPEFMEAGLGCPSKQTATEQKQVFQSILKNSIGEDSPQAEKIMLTIQDTLNTMVEEHQAINDKDAPPIMLTNDTIQEILTESGVPEEITAKIEKRYTEEFGETPPVVEHLLDSKALAISAQKKKEHELEEQVQILQQKLVEAHSDDSFDDMDDEYDNSVDSEIMESADSLDSADADEEAAVSSNETEVSDSYLEDSHLDDETADERPNFDVVLHVKPTKLPQIKTEVINGQKCIIIPMDEDEHANVNGVSALI